MSHPLRWLALVPLKKAELPLFGNLAAWHGEHFPDAPQPTLSAETENLMTFSLGDLTAAATLVARPIPAGQLAGPAATAWYWPTAAADLADHTAHLLVTVIDEGGKPIEKAVALTRLAAAIAAVTPSVGVLWGPGRLIHAPQAFIEQAEQSTADDLPLYLWIDFRIEEQESGVLRLFTTGLGALGAPEIEVDGFAGPPQQLLEYAYNLAHYVVTTKKVIRDGDTMGLTDAVQATLRRVPSMLDGGMEVLRIEISAQ